MDGMIERQTEGEYQIERWADYRRAYAELQGGLHRHKDLMEWADAVMCAGAGHGDPVLSNLIAVEKADLGFICSLDARIREYPIVWRRIMVPRFIGMRDTGSSRGWKLATLKQIGEWLRMDFRSVAECLKHIPPQVEYDSKQIRAMMRSERKQRICKDSENMQISS
ncbi:MAG: hypothetical protein WC710_15180 [Gallionella sp.]|jgi:hypothetical protein